MSMQSFTGRPAPRAPRLLRAARRPRLLLACGLTLLLAACASTPPSTFYTLTPIPEAAGRAGDITGGRVSVGLGPVTFPQFLDRPQIVTRTGSNELSVNEFHRWGGALQDDFLRVWGEDLALLLSSSRVTLFPAESRAPLDFRVPAEVLAFEGGPDGAAVLKVRWSVMDDRLRHSLTAREDAYRCPIRGGSTAVAGADPQAATAARYTAVVAAMSQCLGAFSRDVAGVLARLPKPELPQPPPAPSSIITPVPPAPTPQR
ncbi:MAG: PqiC family protein [Thiohalocapsa sp.]|jgi:hypothetical protein|uniref:PqiC family protein n=1 Tax=Thiohalocapsa sp. TaxID=2497641 RepID=UPI0025E90EA4|nr:PqiC family protein [Thiohalocapsa sp.]MCG6941041.1 PqiC family protein [Thiohalocapsa sp.]